MKKYKSEDLVFTKNFYNLVGIIVVLYLIGALIWF